MICPFLGCGMVGQELKTKINRAMEMAVERQRCMGKRSWQTLLDFVSILSSFPSIRGSSRSSISSFPDWACLNKVWWKMEETTVKKRLLQKIIFVMFSVMMEVFVNPLEMTKEQQGTVKIRFAQINWIPGAGVSGIERRGIDFIQVDCSPSSMDIGLLFMTTKFVANRIKSIVAMTSMIKYAEVSQERRTVVELICITNVDIVVQVRMYKLDTFILNSSTRLRLRLKRCNRPVIMLIENRSPLELNLCSLRR